MRYKITDIDNERYYQMPKSLFSYKAYIGLSLQAKVIYCILKDRMNLSRRNQWIDQNGDIYLMFQQQELADILHVNKSTVCRDMKNLVAYGLIEISEQGRGRCHRIYINKIIVPESSEEISDVEDHLGEAAKQAAEEEAQYQAQLHPEAASDVGCNSQVAYRKPSIAKLQSTVASEQLHVAHRQPQVSAAQLCVAPRQPRVAPTQPNDTNIENLTRETEYNEPEKRKNDEDEEDMRARTPDNQIQEIYDFCAANLHPQNPLVPIEKELLTNWCRRYSPDWVKAAVQDAVLYGRPVLNYVHTILQNWKKYGFRVRPMKSTKSVNKNGERKSAASHQNQTAQEMVDAVKAMWEEMGEELCQ